MNSKTFVGIGVIIFLIIATSPLFSTVIRIGTGAGPAEAILLPLQALYEQQSGNKLDIKYIGPDLAWKELDEGTIDMAFSGLTQSKWKQLMEIKGIPISKSGNFLYTIITKSLIKIIAHKNSTPSQITPENIKAVFSGEITNWKDLGGMDTAVKLVLAKVATGTNMLFSEAMMQNAAYPEQVVWQETSSKVMGFIAKTPGAIGFVPDKNIDEALVKIILHSEIIRPIALMVKGQSTPEINQFIQFLKEHETGK